MARDMDKDLHAGSSSAAPRLRPYLSLIATLALAATIVTSAAEVTSGSPGASEPPAGLEMSPISGPRSAPRRHFRLKFAERVPPAEAERIYAIAVLSMQAGYAASGHEVAEKYRDWQRFNTAPYLSAAHGNHYLNNYANDIARVYGEFEQAGRLPVGSIIAKDTFSLVETGGIVLGPLFVMEKMSPGFNYASGDWRYTAILPDGTVLGETAGRSAERVEFCVACHLARERFDHLYFIPREYRRRGDTPQQ